MTALDAQTTVSARARDEFARRCVVLRERLQDQDFLANRGLGNEVGFYLFCYDPALELEARDYTARLVRDAHSGVLPCRVLELNLYDIFLRICERKRILERIPAQEKRRGLDSLGTLLKRSAGVEAFVETMAEARTEWEADAAAAAPDTPAVALITGVGEIYPILRLHGLFDALQQGGAFADLPVIAFYPGRFTGQSLSLFSRLDDGNYYRAFDLV